jgi:hypothetical protein
MPCSSERAPRFGRIYRLHLQGRRASQAKKPVETVEKMGLVSSSILKLKVMCSSETSGFIWITWRYSQKRVLFIVTAVRTSNPILNLVAFFWRRNCLRRSHSRWATEQVNVAVYSRAARFDSWPGHRVLRVRIFVVFLGPLGQMKTLILELTIAVLYSGGSLFESLTETGHDHFLLLSFKFIIH